MAETSVESPFLKLPEAAAFLRCSITKLRRLMAADAGPTSRRFGGTIVFSTTDLIAWADRQSQKRSEPIQAQPGTPTKQRKAR